MDLVTEIEATLKLANGRVIALWGMGRIGCELRKQIIDRKATLNVECFDKYNENYLDVELLAKERSKYFVIITFVQGYEEAENTLIDMGYEEVRDFICLAKYSRISEKYANGTKRLLDSIQTDLLQIKRKLSMKDNVWQTSKAKFYVPYYPLDFIQRHIVDSGTYFEEDILHELDAYIPDNAIILDIGANIGNHSLYWGLQRKAKIIHAYEPVKGTFEILKRNIEINHLEDVVKCHNIALSDSPSNATFKSYRLENIGDTHLTANDDGDMKMLPLDSMDLDVENIDFIKIDVEDYELHVLAGMTGILRKYKPLVFIESLPHLYPSMNRFMEEHGYLKVKDYDHHNYLYTPLGGDRRKLNPCDEEFYQAIRAKIQEIGELAKHLQPTDREECFDRWYINDFVERNQESIKGNVLEFCGGEVYAKKYGDQSAKVKMMTSLRHKEINTDADFYADLDDASTLPKEKFDCIIATQVIMYVNNVEQSLINLKSMLKPGGTLILTVPGPLFHHSKNSHHMYSFTEESLKYAVGKVFGGWKDFKFYGSLEYVFYMLFWIKRNIQEKPVEHEYLYTLILGIATKNGV